VAGQSKSAQQGFDDGYHKGANAAMDFGKIFGELIGISRLERNDRSKEVQDLINEGRKISEKLAKMEQDGLAEYQAKCKELINAILGREGNVVKE
jgi:hypothetical protein